MESDGRGNYALARINKHARDDRIQFDEPSHKYTVDGTIVTLSVTGLWSQYFEHFNALGMAIRMHKKWTLSGKYALVIAYMQLMEGKSETDVVQGIVDYWSANGRRASDIGTAMHALLEQLLNGAEFSTNTPHTIFYLAGSSDDGEDIHQLSMYLNIVHNMDLEEQLTAFADLLVQLRVAADCSHDVDKKDPNLASLRKQQADLLASYMSSGFPRPYIMINLDVELTQYRALEKEFLVTHNLEPFRTEWSIFHEEADLAGQIDALYRQRHTGEFWMMDWKRVDPSKGLLSSNMIAFADRRGKGPCEMLSDTSFGHYACQQNLYARMLEVKYDMYVSRLYLAQLHCDLGKSTYHVCAVEKMTELADKLIALRVASISANSLV
eukprot:414192-Pleurochrysis_carterae.AAC.1